MQRQISVEKSSINLGIRDFLTTYEICPAHQSPDVKMLIALKELEHGTGT